MDHSVRQHKVAAELRRARLDGLLITHLPNVSYLCGFTGTAGVLVIAAETGGSALYTDGRYTQQAADEVRGAKVVITRKAALFEAGERLGRSRMRVVGFEAEHLSFSAAKRLSNSLRGKVRL